MSYSSLEASRVLCMFSQHKSILSRTTCNFCFSAMLVYKNGNSIGFSLRMQQYQGKLAIILFPVLLRQRPARERGNPASLPGSPPTTAGTQDSSHSKRLTASTLDMWPMPLPMQLPLSRIPSQPHLFTKLPSTSENPAPSHRRQTSSDPQSHQVIYSLLGSLCEPGEVLLIRIPLGIIHFYCLSLSLNKKRGSYLPLNSLGFTLGSQ